MGSWIDEHAAEVQKKRSENSEREKLIQLSGYWLTLRQQVEKDVEQINNHPVFKEILGDKPIRVFGAGNRYQILKSSEPKVNIEVKNEGDKITLRVLKIHYFGDTRETAEDETLNVELNGENIVLVRNKKILEVPEQAAEYMLTPIIHAIKNMK